MSKTIRLAAGSIGVGLVVLAIKTAAWRLTGSAALYSDALETVVNVVTAAVSLLALRVAEKPADAEHPYGHTKAEFLSAVIEGALVIVAALSILTYAWSVLNDPRPVLDPVRGLALSAGGTVLNLLWSLALLRAGAKTRSPALSADGRHLMADVVSSVGIAAGLVAAIATGYWLLDPILAVLTAGYVLWSGARLIGTSVGGLMDAAPPEAVTARIRALVAEHAAGAIEAHDLKSRRSGQASFLEFHLVVPGEMTVAESHAICDRIEDALMGEMAGLQVTIHVEPEQAAKQVGVPVL